MAAALAASLLIAFTLGLMTRSGRTGAGNGTEINATPVTIAKTESPSTPTPTVTQADPTETTEDGHQPSAPMPMSDPIVARLESRGYHVDRRQRLIAVETQDGRRMTMPIEEVRLQFVGNRTY
jgi:hypothetical protein